MPLPKLDVTRAPLSGRSHELNAIQRVFERTTRSKNDPQEVIYIEGSTGTGKSHLVDMWHRTYAPDDTVLVYGKFELRTTRQPYAAIAEAVSQLCQAIPCETLRTIVTTNFGDHHHHNHHQSEEVDQMEILLKCIPGLRNAVTEQEAGGDDDDDDGTRRQQQQQKQQDFSSSSTSGGGAYQNTNTMELSQPFDFESGSHAFDRFSFIFRGFLERCIRGLCQPFVMVIDDIQWADDNSLALLQAIMTDHAIKGILLILIARPQQQQQQQQQQDWDFPIRAAASMESLGRQMCTLSLGNLTVENVNEIVSKLTELSQPTTLALAKIIHDKTQGNAFFVIQFLDSLQRRQLLTYSLVDFRWVWNEDVIRGQMDLADNVAALVLERICSLGQETQRILQMAAYLGASFELESVAMFVRGMNLVVQEEVKTTLDNILVIPNDPVHEHEICGLLGQGVDAGLLHAQGAGRYKFAHDSIHQSFLEADIESDFHTRAGFVILSLYRSVSSGRSWMLFAAMQALNPVAHTLPDESCRLTLLHFNLQAARKAVDRAAFFPAAEYLAVGIKLATQSSENAWITRYMTMLKLYSLAAMVESVCGRHDLCASLASVVFNNAVQAEDRIEAYFAVISSLQGQAKFEEAIKINMDALEELGEKFHRKAGRLTLILAARRTRRIVCSKSEDDIISLPLISDRKTKKKVRLLNTLFLNSYYCRTGPFSTPAWMLLTIMRLLRSTIELGLSQYSPIAFAAYAQILVNAGNVSEGCVYGSIAMKLIEKLMARENLPVATFFLAASVTHLRKPMYQAIPALNLGFQVGMEVGEAHGAFLCATTLVAYKNAIGSPLNEIMQQCESMFRQAKEYSQHSFLDEFLVMWQFTANLSGKTKNPILFDGEFINESKIMKGLVDADAMKNYMKSPYFIGLRMQCSVYMGAWDEALELANMLFEPGFVGKVTKWTFGHYNIPYLHIFAGVVWYKSYTRRGTMRVRAVLDRAKAAFKFLELWVSKGALNVVTGLWLVEAYRAAVDQNLGAVKKMFDRAIVGLHRSGFRNLEALAYEGFATHCLDKQGDVELTKGYMKEAHRLYGEWGAVAKVKWLEQTHGTLLAAESQASFPTSQFLIRGTRQSNVAPRAILPTRPTSWWAEDASRNLTMAELLALTTSS